MHIGDEMENKEREAFEIKFKSSDRSALDYLKYHNITNKYVISNDIDRYQMSEAQDCAHIVNVAWQMWQAAKATPEGFVFNDVFLERKRQIDQEHYSHEHDDEYDQNELIRAASSYLSHVIGRGWVFKETCPETYQDEEAPDLWPWDLDFWKPKNPRRDLVRAAALIIAEIEKIDRSTGAKS